MAAKPKLTAEQWANVRANWEIDPRKPLAWLVQELALPVSAEALRLRAKAEAWEKATGKGGSPKLAKSSKLGKAETKLAKPERPKLAENPPSIGRGEIEVDGLPVALSKSERDGVAALTQNEERFVAEYLIDLNGTQAYMRVFTGAKETSARAEASRILAKPNVAARVAQLKQDRAGRLQLDADRALNEVWAIATADARELVQVKVDCCRHCYGEGHKRQRTVGEMNRDREAHVTKGKEIADFDEEGGIGFSPLLPPHPDCPDCGGDGHARTVLMDTRYLSPQAAALYAGSKQGKNGIEVQMHSKSAAMDKVFRHLGLYEKDNEQKTAAFTTLDALQVFADRMEASRKRQYLMLEERRSLGFTGD